jgi:hypothetical protein
VRLLRANRAISAPSLHSRIVHIRICFAETWFASEETGSIFLLFGAKQTIALNSVTSLFNPALTSVASNSQMNPPYRPTESADYPINKAGVLLRLRTPGFFGPLPIGQKFRKRLVKETPAGDILPLLGL